MITMLNDTELFSVSHATLSNFATDYITKSYVLFKITHMKSLCVMLRVHTLGVSLQPRPCGYSSCYVSFYLVRLRVVK